MTNFNALSHHTSCIKPHECINYEMKWERPSKLTAGNSTTRWRLGDPSEHRIFGLSQTSDLIQLIYSGSKSQMCILHEMSALILWAGRLDELDSRMNLIQEWTSEQFRNTYNVGIPPYSSIQKRACTSALKGVRLYMLTVSVVRSWSPWNIHSRFWVVQKREVSVSESHVEIQNQVSLCGWTLEAFWCFR